MNHGRTVFAQLLEFAPFSHFEHLVNVYQANKGVTTFSAWGHFISLAYAQLTRRSGLRDLVPVSPQIFLHLVETNIFKKVTLDQLVANAVLNEENQPACNQLILL